MRCYRCEKDLSDDVRPVAVDLGYELYMWLCFDCRRILLRDAAMELLVNKIKEEVKK